MTLFNDGLGRTISRDKDILQKLALEYRNSNLMLLAQAGLEIECLQAEIQKLKAASPEPSSLKCVEQPAPAPDMLKLNSKPAVKKVPENLVQI